MPKVLHAETVRSYSYDRLYRTVRSDDGSITVEVSKRDDAMGQPVWEKCDSHPIHNYIESLIARIAELEKPTLEELKAEKSKVSVKLKPYPEWICDGCGTKRAGWPKTKHISTYHTGVCEVCEKNTTVTEPRDWGYPTFPGHEKP